MSYIVLPKPNKQFKVYRADDHPQAIAGGFLTRREAVEWAIASGRTEAE